MKLIHFPFLLRSVVFSFLFLFLGRYNPNKGSVLASSLCPLASPQYVCLDNAKVQGLAPPLSSFSFFLLYKYKQRKERRRGRGRGRGRLLFHPLFHTDVYLLFCVLLVFIKLLKTLTFTTTTTLNYKRFIDQAGRPLTDCK